MRAMAEEDAALTCEPPTVQEERPYKCQQCPRSYRHAGSLVNHRRTHEVGLFRCLLCHKDFSNPMSLKSHLRTHTEEKRHRCPDCGRSVRASSQLPGHHCVARANREQEEEEEEEGRSGGTGSFQRGRDPSSSAVDPGSRVEGGGGSLLTNLEKYIAESVVPADFSQQEFPIQVEGEKQELLPGPGEEGEEPGLLAAAEDERRYRCNQCDKAYKHAGSLTNHKQSHALGAYQCATCHKEFSNLMALRSHARLHSEYRPYKCRFCHKAFRLPSELLSHQKAHGQEESRSADRLGWEDSEHDVWEEGSIETSAKLDIYQPPPVGTGFGDRAPCSLKDASKAGGGERCNPDGELCVRCGGTFANEEELKEHSCLYPEEAGEEEAEGSSPLQAGPSSNGAWEARLKGEDGYPTSEERPFRCGDCGRTYRHAGSLINHKKSHQIGVYSCTICSKQLYNLAALKNHLRVHLRSKLNSSATEEASQNPSAIPDPQKAQDCPDDCPTQPLDAWRGATCPKEEEERAVGEEERPYRCEDCGRSYRHRGSLVNHRHTHQTGIFQCSTCPKQYSNLMALRNHVRVHLRAARMRGRELGDSLTCSNCGESFEEEAEFQLHQLRHLPCTEDIEAAEVPRLGVFHSQEADLLQTIKQDVEALENGAAVVEDILPASEASQVCHRRGLAFPTPAGLQNHAVQHNSGGERLEGVAGGTDPPASIQRLYECDLCGKSYRHSGSLINHKQTHQTGDFSCSLCSKHFQNVASLKSHLRGHQRPRRGPSEALATLKEETETEASAAVPMVISLAEDLGDSGNVLEEDATVNGWQSQVSSPLPGDPEGLPYLCEQCGLGFDQAKDLIDHRQTHQTGIYQCSLCPKEYPTLLALKNHFHAHAKATASNQDNPVGEGHPEEKPFLCSLCGMIFPSEESLQHHHNLLHEEGETPSDSQEVLKRETEEQLDGAGDPEEDQLLSHICGYCGQTFDDMASLEEHSSGHLEEKAAALADTSIQLRRAPRIEDDPPPPPPTLVEALAAAAAAAAEPLDSRPYACGQCGKTYRHGGSLVNHKKIHLIGDYQCSICCRQYRNLSAYRNHLRNHPRCKMNGGVPQLRQPIPAAERGLPCAYERLKDEPCDGSQNGEAPPSNFFLASPVGKERLEQGEELNSGLPESREAQECDISGGRYEKKEAQQALQGTEVTEEEEEGTGEEKGPQVEEEGSPLERPFQCDVCGRSYKHAGSLINHKQTHKTGLFHCSVCQKQFYNLMALKNHNRTHFETKRYRCSECPKAFRLQKQLASHQRVHRDRKLEPSFHSVPRPIRAKRAGKAASVTLLPATAKRPPDPEDRPYRCGQCGRSYRHAGSLLNHQKSHKVGHFTCALCSKAYPNLMSLKNHQRIHYEVKRHQCPDCGKAFKWQRQLQRHQRRPHPCGKVAPGQEPERTKADSAREQGSSQGEAPVGALQGQPRPKRFLSRTSQKNHRRVRAKKRLECSDCGKAYRASRDLMHHLRRHQAEEAGDSTKGLVAASKLLEDQPYKCHSCERTYRHPGSLLNHKKAHATGLYHCPMCQKDFYNLLALKNHLHIHTDKRRHRCPHCGKGFRTAKWLAAHTKVHSRSKEEETFSCTVCSKRFFHQLTFQQHQFLHAKDDGHHALEGSITGEGS